MASNLAEMEEGVNAHMMASLYEKAFNAATAVQPTARMIVFHGMHLVVLEDRSFPVGLQSALFLKPFLDGRYNLTIHNVRATQDTLCAWSISWYR